MSSRILSAEEITAVGTILKDKEAIDILKEIRDNVITEEDTKGKRKNNDVFNFVGFASGDDVLGEDPESDDYKSKKGKIDSLVQSGLVLEGYHVPLERKNEKKFGDIKVADTDGKIYKYQITNEGLAILNLTEEKDKGGESKPSAPAKPEATAPTKTQNNDNTKQKEVESFKQQQSKELGLETKEKA